MLRGSSGVKPAELLLCLCGNLSSLDEVVRVVEFLECLVLCFLSEVSGGSLHLINESLDLVLVFVEQGSNDAVVDDLRAAGLRGKQEDEEDKLDPEVVGDHVEEAASEIVEKGEDAEDDPVGEPLLVVTLFSRLKSLNALDSGVQDGDS